MSSIYVNFLKGGNLLDGTGAISTIGGRWSGTPSRTLSVGAYTIEVRSAFDSSVLAEGTLTVQ